MTRARAVPLCAFAPLRETFLLLSLLAAPAMAGQVLRAGNGAEPETLDPHKAQTVAAINILHDLYEGLASVSPAGAVVPGAAERWTVSADGREYVFYLRPQAKWSNGDALTAADFVAGLRRGVDPATGSVYAQVLVPILNAPAVIAGRMPPEALGVDAPDPLRVRIRLEGPAPHLPALLTLPVAYPIHGPSFAAHGARFARPGALVGNGAYRLEEWVVHSHVRLARNAHYWNDAATAVDAVAFYPTENRESELKRYRAGELDYTFVLPQSQVRWVREHLPQDLRVSPMLNTYYLGLDCTQPPFRDNPGLRQALAMALDRERFVDKVLYGLGTPAYGWVAPGVADYTPQRPDWAAWPREQRLAEARRLYAAAGYSPGQPLRLELRHATGENDRRAATALAALWQQNLGVRVALVNEEIKVYIRRLREHRAQVFLWDWVGDYDDATTFSDVLKSGQGHNYTGWSSARYDAALAQAARQADPAQRRAHLEAAERIVLEEWPLIPVYFNVSARLVKPRVAGWENNVLNHHYSKDLKIVR